MKILKSIYIGLVYVISQLIIIGSRKVTEGRGEILPKVLPKVS